jgi:hypothetical protein
MLLAQRGYDKQQAQPRAKGSSTFFHPLAANEALLQGLDPALDDILRGSSAHTT